MGYCINYNYDNMYINCDLLAMYLQRGDIVNYLDENGQEVVISIKDVVNKISKSKSAIKMAILYPKFKKKLIKHIDNMVDVTYWNELWPNDKDYFKKKYQFVNFKAVNVKGYIIVDSEKIVTDIDGVPSYNKGIEVYTNIKDLLFNYQPNQFIYEVRCVGLVSFVINQSIVRTNKIELVKLMNYLDIIPLLDTSQKSLYFAIKFPQYKNEVISNIKNSKQAFEWATHFPNDKEKMKPIISTSEYAYKWAIEWKCDKNIMKSKIIVSSYALAWVINFPDDKECMKVYINNMYDVRTWLHYYESDVEYFKNRGLII